MRVGSNPTTEKHFGDVTRMLAVHLRNPLLRNPHFASMLPCKVCDIYFFDSVSSIKSHVLSYKVHNLLSTYSNERLQFLNSE